MLALAAAVVVALLAFVILPLLGLAFQLALLIALVTAGPPSALPEATPIAADG